MHDLAIIIVSTNEARWLRPCLTTLFEHAGELSLDVVIADNQSTDGTRELVETQFPRARVVTCENHGFGHANNRGWMTCDARYALFLNPDTEIVEGSFEELVRAMDERPTVGLAGVKQVSADGELQPTIRRFPTPLRSLGEAFLSERWPRQFAWAGERELDAAVYDREIDIDWTSGSFMLARAEALLSAGLMDERSFVYGEEPDLCLRMKKTGWEIRHLPLMTIVHHAGKAGLSARIEAQNAFARRHHAEKHFGPVRRTAFLGANALRYAMRAAAPSRNGNAARRTASVAALKTLLGMAEPPYEPVPPTAVRERSAARLEEDTS